MVEQNFYAGKGSKERSSPKEARFYFGGPKPPFGKAQKPINFPQPNWGQKGRLWGEIPRGGEGFP